MGSLRSVLVAFAFIPLTGCAAQILQASQNDCNAFGYEAGSAQYADCVRGQFNRRQSMVQAYASQPIVTPASTEGPAFLRGQVVRGTSRICTYDRMGSPYVLTVGSAEPCPPTL